MSTVGNMASSHPQANRPEGRETARSSAPEPQTKVVYMEDLRKLQIAHEGMRLLLSSEVKQAEQLFRKSRYACIAFLLTHNVRIHV